MFPLPLPRWRRPVGILDHKLRGWRPGSHAGFVRHDSGLSGDAMAGGMPRTPWSSRRFLRTHDGLHCADLRQGLLFGTERASVVLCSSVFPGVGWRQLRRLHLVAAGAISHGMSRQRFCVFHFVRPVRRRGNHFSGRGKRPPFRVARNSSGNDCDRICDWIVVDSIRSGNSRQATTVLAELAWQSMLGNRPHAWTCFRLRIRLSKAPEAYRSQNTPAIIQRPSFQELKESLCSCHRKTYLCDATGFYRRFGTNQGGRTFRILTARAASGFSQSNAMNAATRSHAIIAQKTFDQEPVLANSQAAPGPAQAAATPLAV